MDEPQKGLVALEDLGWSEAWERLLVQRGPEFTPGRVVIEDKHAYGVVTRQGEVQALVQGRMVRTQSLSELPKVGDWVLLEKTGSDKRWKIREVLPRRTCLMRKQAGREVEEQVLASNVDLVFAVQPMDQRFNIRLLERHLVMAMEGGAEPVVVLNKADLCSEVEARLKEVRSVSGELAIEVVSARTGLGLGRLRKWLKPGLTAVFLGASGVGKSSLVNRLYGEKIHPTLAVRNSDHKGRHSTSWREMVLLPEGGLVIDTPGLREFHLWAAEGGLQLAFPEFEARAVQCKFRDCSHTVETVCAVKAAVESGEIPRDRYMSYVKLHQESKAVRVGTRSEKSAGGPRRRRSGETDRWNPEGED